jgi:hypothetical protein
MPSCPHCPLGSPAALLPLRAWCLTPRPSGWCTRCRGGPRTGRRPPRHRVRHTLPLLFIWQRAGWGTARADHPPPGRVSARLHNFTPNDPVRLGALQKKCPGPGPPAAGPAHREARALPRRNKGCPTAPGARHSRYPGQSQNHKPQRQHQKQSHPYQPSRVARAPGPQGPGRAEKT